MITRLLFPDHLNDSERGIECDTKRKVYIVDVEVRYIRYEARYLKSQVGLL